MYSHSASLKIIKTNKILLYTPYNSIEHGNHLRGDWHYILVFVYVKNSVDSFKYTIFNNYIVLPEKTKI